MSLDLKPSHASVKAYYHTLHQFGQLYIDHEGAVRSAFQDLLAKCGRKARPPLTLVPEYRIERARSSVIVDGALVDLYHLPHGYWEAKDEKDDLAREVERKLDKGYPRDNMIFQAPERAILYQSGARISDENITRPEALVSVVNQFFDYKAPHIQEWEEAVRDFSERIPELATAVTKTIDEEKTRNPAFVRSFEDFYALCKQAINPNLSEEAVERMLVQHMLTERIFRKIFDNPDFTRRNVVAAEIEKVIAELTKRSLNRDDFLRNLERFYRAIERSAEETTNFSEKQAFLNKVYERFFQGYSPREADTHGIVYTPQPIVNFMVRSVEEILQKEFGRSLGDKGVHILDPFVGTGNFIVRIMQEIKATDLPYKYENELHCNEVMLLPYYIASMNIEHAYFDRAGEYKPFPGICLVDTFELAEPGQGAFGFMTAENAERVKRQKDSPIFVIIGNPPYNAWQVNENDNNKNRTYPVVDGRVAATYAASSSATNKNALSDMYVKAFRWASDRIGEEGVIALISNNGFLDGLAFDGMRRDLGTTFSKIYHLNLKGNARTSGARRQQEGGNIFENAIRVGVGITLLVKSRAGANSNCIVRISSVEDGLTLAEKQQFLLDHQDVEKIPWREIQPDSRAVWLTEGIQNDYGEFLPLGSGDGAALFDMFSNGLKTNRDVWTYSFDRTQLVANAKSTIEFYNLEVDRWKRSGQKGGSVDEFVRYDGSRISWSRDLKNDLRRERFAEFNEGKVRRCLYRPYVATMTFFDRIFNEEVYSLDSLFPSSSTENEMICVTGPGSEKPFLTFASSALVDFHLVGAASGTQCFPFYTYAEDGTNRRENITDWVLEQFRARYGDRSITKWDIFHYIYAVLHHPEYRQRYAANLRRELPRVPFVSATPGAKAQLEGAPNAALKRRSSTVTSSRSSTVTSSNDGGRVGTSVEERPFRAASEQEDSRALAPVPSDLDVFHAFAHAGQRLAEIHVHYEQQPEYPLTKTEKAGEKLDYRVTKMRLSKDKTSLIYNQFLTLSGIPPDTYEYRLGNRSALEWVIDQYQVSTDKRSGITNDPNREDDPQYILRLIGQVITVSLETVKIVRSLPALGLPPEEKSPTSPAINPD